MRKTERQFLKRVGKELIPLYKIEKKLNWSSEQVKSYADYFIKKKIIRQQEMIMDNGVVITLVAKELDLRTWKEKNWLLIAFIFGLTGYVAGIFSPIITEWLKQILKLHTQ